MWLYHLLHTHAYLETPDLLECKLEITPKPMYLKCYSGYP